MTHYPGLRDWTTNRIAPLCSTRERPVSGETTQHTGRIDCPDCRKMLRMGEDVTQRMSGKVVAR